MGKEERLIKILFIWAHNEDLSLKLKDVWLLKETQSRLSVLSPVYIHKINQYQFEDNCNPYDIQEILEFNCNKVTDTQLNSVKSDISFYCSDCGVPVFKGLNMGNSKVLCLGCIKDNIC